MSEPTPAPPPRPSPDSSWQFDLASPAETLRVGVSLSFAPDERAVVICVEARRGTELVLPISGLAWAQSIASPFAYFPSPDRTVWFSPHITFAEPVDHVRVTALHWPARRPLSRSEITRLFIRVPEGSGTHDDASLSALYFAPVGGTR